MIVFQILTSFIWNRLQCDILKGHDMLLIILKNNKHRQCYVTEYLQRNHTQMLPLRKLHIYKEMSFNSSQDQEMRSFN